MRRLYPSSLAGQLLLWLIAAQTGLVVVAMAAFPLLAPYVRYDDIADGTVRRLLTDALIRGPDGRLALAPSEPFTAYRTTRPELAFALAAVADRQPVPGSAPDLSAMIDRLGPLLPTGYGNLETDRPGFPGGIAIVTTQSTRFGDVVVVTAGNAFGIADLRSFLEEFAPTILPSFGPLLLGAGLAVPLVIRRVLRRTHQVARAAAAIDMASLDRRLPEYGLPSELQPLVRTLNETLDRLADGVARQRLFTANAAHELRTPIAILQARLESLPDGVDRLHDLRRDARRLALLVDQMLAVARIGYREATIDDDIDLGALLKTLVADCAPLAIRAGRAVALCGECPARVRGNRRALEGAFANLIDNAIRAEPPGGTVEVLLLPGPAVEICDHGSGVDKRDSELVFEPFWHKASDGNGLGLAIVRQVANLHRARILIRDTAGGGATFRFEFSAEAVLNKGFVRLAQ
jgi:signal transduction histidine kinase